MDIYTRHAWHVSEEVHTTIVAWTSKNFALNFKKIAEKCCCIDVQTVYLFYTFVCANSLFCLILFITFSHYTPRRKRIVIVMLYMQVIAEVFAKSTAWTSNQLTRSKPKLITPKLRHMGFFTVLYAPCKPCITKSSHKVDNNTENTVWWQYVTNTPPPTITWTRAWLSSFEGHKSIYSNNASYTFDKCVRQSGTFTVGSTLKHWVSTLVLRHASHTGNMCQDWLA